MATGTLPQYSANIKHLTFARRRQLFADQTPLSHRRRESTLRVAWRRALRQEPGLVATASR